MADYNKTNYSSRAGASESISTNGIMLRNYEARKFLACSHWNKTAVIEIGTIPDNVDQDFTAMRNVQTIKQVMTFNTLTTLDQILEDAIASIKSSGQLSPAGAPAGASFNNLVEITDGSNLDPNLGLKKGVYLVIYKDWDNTRTTQKFDIYPFSTRTIIRGYDHNTGRGVEDIDKIRDLKDFHMFVHEACKAMTNAQAHAIMEVSRKERTSSIRMLSAIANGLGIDIGATPISATAPARSSSEKSGSGFQGKKYGDRSGGKYGNNNGNGGYRNGYTGYRGGSTGGFQNRQNNNRPQQNPFSNDDGVSLELNMNSVEQVPIDQFM